MYHVSKGTPTVLKEGKDGIKLRIIVLKSFARNSLFLTGSCSILRTLQGDTDCSSLCPFHRMHRVPPPPLTCKMCIPPAHFRKYEEFRKHLRIHHQMKHLSPTESRQFENYPGAMEHVERGPPSQRKVRETVQGQATNASQSLPVPKNVAQSSGANRFAIASTSQSMASRSSSGEPNNNNQVRGEASASANATNAPNVSTSEAVHPSPTSSEVRAMLEQIVRQQMEAEFTKHSLGSTSTESNRVENTVADIVQHEVKQQIANELKNRLPLLGAEIRQCVRGEVKDTIIQLMDMAKSYDEEKSREEESPYTTNRASTVPAIMSRADNYVSNRRFISDGLNVRVEFQHAPINSQMDRSLGAAGSNMDITHSDEELLEVSQSILDGTARNDSVVSFICKTHFFSGVF